MPKLKDIAPRLLTPLLYANLGVTLLGFALLTAAGQWALIGTGIVLLIFSPFILPPLAVPAGVMAHLMAKARAEGNAKKENILFLSSSGYMVLLLAFWCAGVVSYFMMHTVVIAAKPGLLWAAGLAMTPLFWWSIRDRENLFIALLVEVAQIVTLALAGLSFFGGDTVSFWPSALLYTAIMGIFARFVILHEEKSLSR